MYFYCDNITQVCQVVNKFYKNFNPKFKLFLDEDSWIVVQIAGLCTNAERLNKLIYKAELEQNYDKYKKEMNIVENEIHTIFSKLPFKVNYRINRSPSGCPLYIYFPDENDYNTWGGKEDGWGIY